MSQTIVLTSGDRQVRVVSTDASDGDFAVSIPSDQFDRVRRPIVDLPWSWLNQVHGTDVVEATAPGDNAGVVADGIYTTHVGCPIAVTTADCAPVVLTSSSGVAVVHAGWKGALAGIIGAAAQRLLADGSEPGDVWLGPCIAPASYQFSTDDLHKLEVRFGSVVVGETADGKPALNMFEVIKSACLDSGWPEPVPSPNTAEAEFFSHRARGDKGRQTTVAYIL